MWLFMVVGCTEIFDISSTVLVRDEQDSVVTQTDAVFCQRLSTDYTSKDVEAYFEEACFETDIVNGIAELDNWEGLYKGDVSNMELWWQTDEKDIPATLIDTDEDVWCDNVDTDTDINGNTTSTQFCTSNYEFYLLWEVQIPN